MLKNQYLRFGLFAHFFAVLILLILMSYHQAEAAVNKNETVEIDSVSAEDPGADLWRNVRQRQFAETTSLAEITSQVKSGEANILINVSGQSWREYRMEQLIPIAGIVFIAALAGVLLFFLLRGRIKLKAGRSGMKLLRFTFNQRTAHWTVAILFIILAVTGLILMFGRDLLIPVLGKEFFGNIATVSKTLHDYLGPAFGVALIIMFFLYVRDNIPTRHDIEWLRKGGGLFSGGHVSSDRYNTMEKGWFWVAGIVGGAVVVSGLVLDFPIFGQTRETMEFYHIIHSSAAVIVIVGSFGHIYMGTAGVEGAFEVMQTGYCDANWAKEHHDLWYEKVKHSAEPVDDRTAPDGSEKAIT